MSQTTILVTLGFLVISLVRHASANIVQETEPIMADVRSQDAFAVKCYDGHFPMYFPSPGIAPSHDCGEVNRLSDTIAVKLNQRFPGAGYSWFFLFRERFLFSQIDACAKLGAAGNEEMATTCRRGVLNAHDFLTQLALGRGLGNPSITQWIACSHELESNLEMGARCIVAARDMASCRPDPNDRNKVADYNQCMTLLTSGDWIANPKALAISFDSPRVDARRP
jgi:hypothetical protein